MISNEEFIVIDTLYAQGHSIRSISRITGMDRRTISKRLKESKLKPYKKRSYKSKLDMYKEYIDKRLKLALPHKIPSSVIYDDKSIFYHPLLYCSLLSLPNLFILGKHLWAFLLYDDTIYLIARNQKLITNH